MNLDLFSAFVIGLLGSGHCLGMCGGITTMLTAALPANNAISPSTNLLTPASTANVNLASKQKNSRYLFIVFYHFGRIFSYGIIGAIVGFSGSIAAKNIGLPLAGLRVIAALFLILLGLYLGQWLMLLNKVENIGKKLWQLISPLSKQLLPINSPSKALGLGLLWGWLPCGLVYSTLTWSLASHSLQSGFLIMIVFGLGTLPALLSVSFGFLSFKTLLLNTFFRKSMAILVITYGLYSLVIATKTLFLYY
ncbi:MAG: hypothetical protein COB35_07435 [Gammaproteobacteria bacterium]|nr:MAG: hypothetical protein COB35_07435 [Gammaproteobacteria bacterium]